MVNWHGILTILGILIGWHVSRRMAKRYGVDPEEISRMAPAVIFAAVIGGRAAYVLTHLDEFAGSLWEVVRIDHGGLASHGALLLGIVTVYAYARRRGFSVERLLDAAALAVPINYLAMRIGNFLIGELYGDPTSLPWGVMVPGAEGLRHPAQLYDALGQAIVLAVLIPVALRPQRPGRLFWLMLIGTSIVRLFSDLFRTELRALGPPTLGQAGAILTIAAAVVILALASRRREGRLAEAQEHAVASPWQVDEVSGEVRRIGG